MSRRAPPRDYYEEDEYEYEREIERERDRDRDRDPRPRRREPEFAEDVEYRRRRSMPPPEDFERMRTRERPPRDFMQESFAPPRERERMSMRRSRDEVDEVERQPDELYVPSRRHRGHKPREMNEEDLIFEERERRRMRRPREVDEELMFDEKERRRGRRSREIDEEDYVVEERERRRDRRPREVDEEELIVEERERRRERRPREVDEEELIVDERERYRGPRRREVEEEDMIFEERERHTPRPLAREEDDLIVEEKEKRRVRRPRRMSEDDRIFNERERRRGPRPRMSDEEPIVRERRRHRPDRDIEEDELRFRRREGPPPGRGRESDGELPPLSRSLEEERDEKSMRSSESRRRPRPRGTQVEEIIIDDRKREVPPHGGRHRRDPRIDEEIIMRWKDRPSPREQEEDEELHYRETMRHRRNQPESIAEREPPGAFPIEQDDEFRKGVPVEEMSQRRSASRLGRSPEIVDEPLEEVTIQKEKIVSAPREAPDEPIRAPPIHQEVITHHRHIDHGFEGTHLPRAPSPELPASRAMFDEVNIRHRSSKGGRKSEEDIVYKHRDEEEEEDEEDEEDDDESISPTSGPSLEFSNPWDRRSKSSRRKPPSIDDERISLAAQSAHTRGRQKMPRKFEGKPEFEEEEEEEVEIREKRSIPRSMGTPKSIVEEWSTAEVPSKVEDAEMSGALSIIEVAPKHAVEDELERDIEVGQRVEKENRDERWTEITRELVVKEAIQRLGYEFEETPTHYYIFSFLGQREIDEIIELSDGIRSARRRRIREMQRERASLPPPPRPRRSSLVERLPVRPPRMTGERRVREREWIIDPGPRHSGRF